MEHFCTVDDIKVKTFLTPDEAYKIALEYHEDNKLIGKIPEDMMIGMYLDEKNHITNDITWMVRSVLEKNTFEGMNEITLVISDDKKIVCCVLDHNGIPMG